MKKRVRAVRSRVGRIARITLRVALSEDGVSMGRLRWRGLVDHSGAHWLLVASATSEATFPKVTLIDGVSSGETGDTTTKGLEAGFPLRTGLVGFAEGRAMGPLAEQAGRSIPGTMSFGLTRRSWTFLLTEGSRWARLAGAVACVDRAPFWPRGTRRHSWGVLNRSCLWGSGLSNVSRCSRGYWRSWRDSRGGRSRSVRDNWGHGGVGAGVTIILQ